MGEATRRRVTLFHDGPTPPREALEAIERAGSTLLGVRHKGDAGASELVVTLANDAPGPLRAQLLALAERSGIDAVLHRHDVRVRVAVFDVDSTLLRIEVIDELARAAGRYAEVAAITERAMRGELDFPGALRARVEALAGVSVEVLERLSRELPLMDGAEALFVGLRAAGVRTAVFSGGFTGPVRALQARLGVEEAHANELELADGRLTGRVLGEIVDGARKQALLEAFAARCGVPLEACMAVGDGANDRAMVQRAGLGLAFRAKPKLREVADGWLSARGLDAALALLEPPPPGALREGGVPWP